MCEASPGRMLIRFSLYHVLAVAVFIHGFLLTRIELPYTSSCDDVPTKPGGCWSSRAFDRAVVVIVDALRYDFVVNDVYNASYEYAGIMPKMLGTAQRAGDAAALLRFVADTPTITMSRLKALVTGGLPTFLDVGSSFSASTITEDNLIQQLQRHGRRLAFMGDDTWMQLLPGAFQLQHPFPSFNVKDLHTVDDGVWKHLVPLLQQPQRWDVLVAHYLGVDHAGHTHGVRSRQMLDKVQQMDEQLDQIIGWLMQQAGPGQVYDRTLLVVMGDHGQTLGGDHGGGSPEETDSVLLTLNLGKYYSRWQQHHQQQQNARTLQQQNNGPGDAGSARQGRQPEGTPAPADSSRGSRLEQGHCSSVRALPSSDYLQLLAAGQLGGDQQGCIRSMVQVDLTPALALLLGVPIPYGNLGKVPVELWQVLGHNMPLNTTNTSGSSNSSSYSSGSNDSSSDSDSSGSSDSLDLPWLRGYMHALAANAWQVHRYLQAYSARASLPRKELRRCLQLYARAAELHAALPSSTSAAAAAADRSGAEGSPSELAVAVALLRFLEATFDLARKQFTQFNMPAMVLGSALMIACVLRQIATAGQTFGGGAWRAIISLEGLIIVGMALAQAFSAFSVNYLMGEGRVHCYTLAAAGLLLLRSALVAVLRARAQLARLQLALSSGTLQQGGTSIKLQQLQHAAAGCRPVLALAYGFVMLACTYMLMVSGLIDRSGQDPHDKSQPTVELMGPGAAQVGWLQVARVQLPLLLVPAVFLFASRQLSFSPAASSSNKLPAQGTAATAAPVSAAHLLPKLLAAAVAVEYACISAWWCVQMFDVSKQVSVDSLLAQAQSAASGLQLPGLKQLPAQLADLLAGIMPVMRSMSSMHLRLLLPRVVYGTACAAAVLAVAMPAIASVQLTVKKRTAASATGPVMVGVMAVFSGPLVLLLGYAGPGTVLLGLLQAGCSLALMQQTSRAEFLSAACKQLAADGLADGTDEAAVAEQLATRSIWKPFGRLAASKAAADDDPELAVAQGQGRTCGVGGMLWMMLCMQLFFCSQHFCEFTGLQYTSPFVGFDDMEYYRGFVMLSINSFGMQMLGALSLPLLALLHSRQAAELQGAVGSVSAKQQGQLVLAGFRQAASAFSAVRALSLCMSMLASVIMLRHILMWAIFAPKLVFELFFACWVDVFLLLAAWLLWLLIG